MENRLTVEEKQKIAEAVHLAETKTTGEIRVHVSYSMQEHDILSAAKLRFEHLGMHKTRERNAMLLFINPSLRKFALFGDEGIHQKVGQSFWDKLSGEVKGAIQSQSILEGMIIAIREMGLALQTHFPGHVSQQNELSNEVSE